MLIQYLFTATSLILQQETPVEKRVPVKFRNETLHSLAISSIQRTRRHASKQSNGWKGALYLYPLKGSFQLLCKFLPCLTISYDAHSLNTNVMGFMPALITIDSARDTVNLRGSMAFDEAGNVDRLSCGGWVGL